MSTNPFKAGDKVVRRPEHIPGSWTSYVRDGKLKNGTTGIYTVKSVSGDRVFFVESTSGDWAAEYFTLANLTLDNMSLLEKAALAFKKEPEKSFRKAGVTNGDDILTDEGTKVFLGFLLKKHGEEFKKEVVDPILKESK